MPRSPRPHPAARRTATLALALLLVPAAVACGVDGGEELRTNGPGPLETTTTTTVETTTTTIEEPEPDPPCAEELVGGSSRLTHTDVTPTCIPEPEPDPEPDPDPDPEPGPDGDEQAYVDAIAADLTSASTVDDLSVTGTQARCVAPIWVDTIGTGALADAGLTPEAIADGRLEDAIADLVDRDQAQALVDAFTDCGLDLGEALRVSLVDSGSLTEQQSRCLTDAIGLSGFEGLLVDYLDLGDAAEHSPNTKALTAAFASCT